MNSIICRFRSEVVGALLIILIELISMKNIEGTVVNWVLPCEFQDSINITEGTTGPYDSIIFNNIMFRKDQYAKIDYYIKNRNVKMSVPPYLRGCPCKIKTCIRLCCPIGKVHDKKRGVAKYDEIFTCANHSLATSLEHDILDKNNNMKTIKLEEVFSFVTPTFRANQYIPLDKFVEYNITHTGHIFNGSHMINYQSYCLRTRFNEESNEIEIDALMFVEKVDPKMSDKEWYFAIVMLSAVPFVVTTLLVYIFIPELRNLHGKCLVCYLSCLVISCCLFGWMKLNGWNYVEPTLRKSIGQLTYFSTLSMYFWSNIISYDLHRNFRTTHFFKHVTERKRFVFYMIYAFGVPLMLSALTLILDLTKPISDNLLPNIGTETFFFRDRKHGKLAPFLYFYMIICIICSLNIVYFVLTALKIRQAQQDILKITSMEESARHQGNLNNERDNVLLFMRLFIIMGITVIMEGVTFLTSDPYDSDSNIFVLLMDLWNLSQGIIIFILFVMKRRVLNLIKKRCLQLMGKNTRRQTSYSLTKTSNADTQYVAKSSSIATK